MRNHDARLFHFSDDPDIEVFVPRPVRTPSQRPPGQDWLNGPLVWAIEERREYMYLFPRDCPRILIWDAPETTPEDKEHWLGDSAAVAYVERGWHTQLKTATIFRYHFPVERFESLDDAGMWVSRETVIPEACDRLHDLPAQLAQRGVDLRVVDSLHPLRSLLNSSLHFSGIRLRNAIGWER